MLLDRNNEPSPATYMLASDYKLLPDRGFILKLDQFPTECLSPELQAQQKRAELLARTKKYHRNPK